MNSPRNPTTAALIALLDELDFKTWQMDDQWVAVRMSGLRKTTIILPDDPVVPGEFVMGSLLIQSLELADEIEEALRESGIAPSTSG